MNPEPVEDCIHNTLSALYPPFDATAPTLFCQVFEVVARTYREDALRYTIEFLIPAKHILQRVQQDACSQYNGFLFCHEGWPLCLHEKVVVQLASLPWQHLRPGDFYLQVVPYLECSPRLVLKCLSTDSYSVQEVPVPEDSYSYIFTVEWLNGINKDRHTGRLENCLLAADDQVLRVPWSEVVYPQFVHKDEFIVGKRCSLDLMPPESLVAAHVPEILGARSPGDGRISNSDSKDCQAGQENQGKKPVRMGSITTLDPSDHPQLENIEGEYVELLEISLPLKDGGNNKEKYLGDQNIFKTKTVPTRKGHGKGRNKRHRAWLHQKMPKEDIQPGKNQVRRTWDGGKPVEEEEPHSASQIIQTEGTNQMENHPNSEEQVKGEGDYISPDIARSLVQARVDLGEAEGDHAKAGEKPKTSSTNLPSQMKYGLNDTSVAISMQSEHTPSDSIVEGRKSTLSPVACAGNPESEASDEQSSLLVDLIGQELILKYGYNQSSFPPIEGSTVEDTLTAQPSSSLSTNTQELQSMVAPTSAGAKGSPDRKEQEEHQDVLGDLLGANLELQTRTGPVPEGGSELAEGSPGLGGSGEQLMKGLEAEAAVVEDPDNENLKSKKTGKEPCDSQGTNLAERAIIGSERAEKNGGPLVNIAPKKHGKGKRRKKKGNWKGSARAEEQREKSRDATGLSRAEEAPEDLKTGTHTQGTGPDLEPVEEPEVTRLETACEADLLPQKEAPEVIGITESAEVQAEDNRLEEQEPLSEEAVGQQVVSSLPGDDASAGLPEEPEAVPAAPERDRAGSPQNASLPAPPSPTGLPPGQEVNWDILQSGIFCLTGGVDRAGRALVTVNPWALEAWRDASYSSRDLVGTLVHLSSLLRKEVRDLGLTLILDLRASPLPPPAAVLRALGKFQEMPPRSATSILILTDATDPDAAPLPEGLSTLQGAERTGLEELRRRVSLDQLPPGLGGSLAYSHSEWMQTQRTLDSLSQLCLEVLRSLLEVIEDMEAESSPEASEDIPSLIAQQQESMSKVLLDGRLSELQRSGGALIARLQKSPSHRNHTAAAFQLYEEVDEAIHRLVRLSNQRLRGLESHLELCRRQDQIREILAWVADEGERRLAEAGVLEAGDPVKALRRALEDFRSFRALAKEKLTQGLDALRQVESWEISPPRDRSGPCQRLEAFGQRLERKEDELQRSLHLYEFFQRAHEWALEGVRRLAAITEGSCSPRQRQEALLPLAQYQQQHPEIPERLFKEAKATALELQDQAALREWAQCWFKCQEIRKIVQKKTEAALGGAKAPPGPASRSPEGHRKRSDSVSLAPGKGEGRRFWGFGSVLSPSRSMTSLLMPPPPPPLGGPLDAASFQSLSPFGELAETAEEDVVFDGPAQRLDAPCGPHAPTLPVGEKVPWEPRKRGPASEGSASPFPRPRAFRGLLKKAQSMDSPAPPPADAVRPGWGQRALSEPGSGQGNVGVYIKGLEVSSTEVVDRTCSPKEHVMIGRGGSLMADAPWGGTPRMERKRRICNLQRLMTEAIGREREYVAWLSRALETHRKEPETWRDEAPQEPRLDWSALWWSLEKLQAFHAGYFLKELEGCLSHPLRVATCFLRYADQVSLYALYVKNRRKVEPVLSAHGAFFKSKQEEQEDGTGLGQHLQKPLEQLERYQRFLGEMTRECEPELVQECQSLRAAQELLGSQVHHGKNLFAVDSIRGFEVDLKEQGQLLLRDEFTIFSGRKRAQRQVFLFQHLLLFSKLKTTDGGQETYGYKQSFKTVDMGLTEEIGDSGLRFEVWFRRKKSREAYVFHASSPEVKHRWTSVIAQLLWTQASQNKDSQQTGSMAIGNKSFLDLRASFGAISERAINALLTGKGARTRASVAVSAFDHSGPFCERCPPSCCASVLGPLNLQLPGSPGSDRLASPGASSLPGRIEEEDSWDPVVSEVSLGGSDFGEPAENQRDCSQSSREPEGWARGCHNRSLSVPGNVSEKQSPIQDPATIPSPSTPV